MTIQKDIIDLITTLNNNTFELCNIKNIKILLQKSKENLIEELKKYNLYYYNRLLIYYNEENILQHNKLICILLYNFCVNIYFHYKHIEKIYNFISEFKSTQIEELYNNFKIKIIIDASSNNSFNKKKSIANSNFYNFYMRYIINSFNYDILNITCDYDNSKLIQYIDIDFDIIKQEEEFKTTTIHNINLTEIDYCDGDYIMYFLKIIINTIKDIYIEPDIKYVTIPQYGNICWFISMITGISYSDESRKLITSVLGDSINETNKYFYNFIKYIKDEISEKKLEYNKSNYKDFCNIYIKLKEEPLFLLNKIIIALSKDISSDNIKSAIKNIIISNFTYDKDITDDDIIKLFEIIIKNNYTNTNYGLDTIIAYKLTEILNNDISEIKNILSINNPQKKQRLQDSQKLSQNNSAIELLTNFIYEKINSIEEINIDSEQEFIKIHLYNKSILSYLYDLLKISNKFFYKYIDDNDNNIIKEKIKNIVEDYNPDVIIINNTKYTDIKDIKDIKDSSIEFNSDDTEITYNSIIYKLDYIIQSTDSNLTCKNCGHCISAITYHNEEYYYDSSYEVKKIKCDDKDIYLPCSLIQQKWKDKINTECCYKITKCEYEKIDIKKLNFKEKNLSNTNICYNKNNNILLVYIKKVDKDGSIMTLEGGKNKNKYKSLHTKIAVIHKSKIYNRTVYVKDNIKYIIFNKEYILLSKLKYKKQLKIYEYL